MILPTMASLCHASLQAVPRSLRRAAFALGAGELQVALGVVLPAARSGTLAACALGLSRVMGETMAVTLAAGARPQITLDPLASIQTLTAYIVQVALGDSTPGTSEYHGLFAVGLVLFVMTLGTNAVGLTLRRRPARRAQ